MIFKIINKQNRKILIAITIIILVGSFLTTQVRWFYPAIMMAVLIGVIIIYFESKRRKEILSLTMYLKRLNHHDYNYELIDFNEGDMSLLKSEVHKTMYLLKNYNETLEQQKEFIYTSLSDISHQLKTPITGLQLMLDLMDGEDERLVHMNVQTQRLQTLVEGLLTHIQLEAHSIKMHKHTVSSTLLVSHLLEMVHTDLPIETDLEPFEFFIDEKWTLEALFNVLNNKLRYAKSHITIRVYRNKLYHVIEISDDGESIANHERTKIFERFYKGERSDSNSVGIGLAITREIMELQNGKVTIKDENTFRFLFDDKTVTSL